MASNQGGEHASPKRKKRTFEITSHSREVWYSGKLMNIQMKREVQTLTLPDEFQGHRMCLSQDGDQLWFPPNNDTNKLYSYNFASNEFDVIELSEQVVPTNACTQRKTGNQNIIVTCKDGLYEIDPQRMDDKHIPKLITGETSCDIACNGDYILALSNQQKVVRVFEDVPSSSLEMVKSIGVPEMTLSPYNTILASNDDRLYICCFKDQTMIMYKISSGQRIAEIKLSFTKPVLCASSKDGHVLVASYGDNKFFMYNIADCHWDDVTPVQEKVSKVTDTVLDSDDNLWVLQQDGKTLTRYKQ